MKNCVVEQRRTLEHMKDQFYQLNKKNKETERKHPKSKLNNEELCCKAEARASAPDDSILLPEEDDERKGKETS